MELVWERVASSKIASQGAWIETSESSSPRWGRGLKMKPKITKAAVPDHVPGPMEEAAVRAFFERGSKQALDSNRWRVATFLSLAAVVAVGALAAVVAARQEVFVMQVSKDASGDLQVAGAAKTFSPDEDSKMAWSINYAQTLTEISPAIWRRNVDRVVKLSSGVAVDQVRAYLGRNDSNPAALLNKNELYVREFHRKSVNKVAENTYLVRYELISRITSNETPKTQSFAMTVTVANVGYRSREDVFNNPAGLVATNFSISEEKKNTELK